MFEVNAKTSDLDDEAKDFIRVVLLHSPAHDLASRMGGNTDDFMVLNFWLLDNGYLRLHYDEDENKYWAEPAEELIAESDEILDKFAKDSDLPLDRLN